MRKLNVNEILGANEAKSDKNSLSAEPSVRDFALLRHLRNVISRPRRELVSFPETTLDWSPNIINLLGLKQSGVSGVSDLSSFVHNTESESWHDSTDPGLNISMQLKSLLSSSGVNLN